VWGGEKETNYHWTGKRLRQGKLPCCKGKGKKAGEGKSFDLSTWLQEREKLGRISKSLGDPGHRGRELFFVFSEKKR